MQSKAATVEQYLAELPHDRRGAIQAVRQVILDNIDPTFEERMGYGMPGWVVPHSVFPAGYHCDPKQPLPYAGLASQKGHMSLYLMGLYTGPASIGLMHWFHDAWAKTGKKLDMGKACIRFKKLEDLPLDVIAEAIRRVPAKAFIAAYEAGMTMRPGPTKRSEIKKMVAKREAEKAKKKAGAKKAVTKKKVAKKKVAKKRAGQR